MIPELSDAAWGGIAYGYFFGGLAVTFITAFIEELDLPEKVALVTVWPITLSFTVIWFLPTGLLKLARRITA